MKAQPVRFCLAIDHRAWARGNASSRLERTVQLARLADEAGFDSIWVNEDPDGWDAFAMLGAMAQETASIRLGPGVVNPYYRHPSLIAASVATLDILSSERAFLGLGRGEPSFYHHTFGMETSRPLERLENTITLLRSWWRDRLEGDSRSNPVVHRWKRLIAPAGKPPIYLAAAGPRALELAGRRADGVLFNRLATPTYLEWAISVTRSAAETAGRDPQRLSFFVDPAIAVTDNPAPILKRQKAFVALVHGMPGMGRMLESDQIDIEPILSEIRVAMKTDEILAAGGHFSRVREEGDFVRATAAIPDRLIMEAAAIGSLDHVKERIAEFQAVGATHLFFDRRSMPRDPTELQDLLRQLAA